MAYMYIFMFKVHCHDEQWNIGNKIVLQTNIYVKNHFFFYQSPFFVVTEILKELSFNDEIIL